MKRKIKAESTMPKTPGYECYLSGKIAGYSFDAADSELEQHGNSYRARFLAPISI
jgi:hypothetical protein